MLEAPPPRSVHTSETCGEHNHALHVVCCQYARLSMYGLDTPIALHSRGLKNTNSHEPVPGGLLYPPVLEKLARWLSN